MSIKKLLFFHPIKIIVLAIGISLFDFDCLKAQITEKELLGELETAKYYEKADVLNKLAYYYNDNNGQKNLDFSEQALEYSQKIFYKRGIADANLNLATYYYDYKDELTKSIFLNLQAYRIYEEAQNQEGMAHSLLLFSKTYRRQKQYSQSLEYALKALSYYKALNHSENIINTYIQMGGLYKILGDNLKASECYFEALKVGENLQNKTRTARIFENLAGIYQDEANYKKSLEFNSKSLQLQQELGNQLRIANAMAKVGLDYENLGKYDTALEYSLKALAMYKELDFKSGIVRVLNNIGSVYTAKEDYFNANDYLTEALNRNKKNSDEEAEAMISNNLAICYKENNQPDVALKFASRALSLAQKIKNKAEIKKANLILSEVYASVKDFELAYEHKKMYDSLQTGFLDTLKNKQIIELDAKYQVNKKDIEIVELKLKNDFNQALIEQSDTINLLAFTGLGLLSLLLLLIYNRFLIKKKNARVLLEKNTEIEFRNDTLQQLSFQLQASLKEKETLLKEIHHRVKNNLQVISSLLSLQSNTLSDPKALEAVREGQNRVKSMALIHQNLYQTENLDNIDFQEYLQQLIAVLAQSYSSAKQRISSQVKAEGVMLDMDVAIPIGLIVNELVSNAYKYAFEKEQEGLIEVALSKISNLDYQLVVEDNGKGLINTNIEQIQSLGLRLVNILTSQIGGNLKVESDLGTKFTILFSKNLDKQLTP